MAGENDLFRDTGEEAADRLAPLVAPEGIARIPDAVLDELRGDAVRVVTVIAMGAILVLQPLDRLDRFERIDPAFEFALRHAFPLSRP